MKCKITIIFIFAISVQGFFWMQYSSPKNVNYQRFTVKLVYNLCDFSIFLNLNLKIVVDFLRLQFFFIFFFLLFDERHKQIIWCQNIVTATQKLEKNVQTSRLIYTIIYIYICRIVSFSVYEFVYVNVNVYISNYKELHKEYIIICYI